MNGLMRNKLIIIMIIFLLTYKLFVVEIFSAQQSSRKENGSPGGGSDINKIFVDAANSIIPSVVSIHCIKVVGNDTYWKDEGETDELDSIFPKPSYQFPFPNEFRQKGSGSGMIVSRKGYILTNVHVIEEAESIHVVLNDKRTYKAEILGIDPLTEIALIKIDATGLRPVTLGDSDECRVGEWVLAVGNPLELNSTITAGIISAKGREINIIRDTYGVENFIQTDAAINPGNSGGPLINLNGEVIGITTAIATENGYSQGYGFAIPINLAREILNDLIRYGKVTRGYLGISMQDIDEIKARALGLKKPFGVFIDTIDDDGPAYVAGLREKDVLIKIDDTQVNRSNHVQSLIAQKNPGDEVILSIIRKNKILRLMITLEERHTYSNVPKIAHSNVDYKNLGLQVEEIKPESSNIVVRSSRKGLIVSAVQQFSPAFEAGIHVNDIIKEIDDAPIYSIEQFNTTIKTMKHGDVTIMKIERDNTVFHAFVEK